MSDKTNKLGQEPAFEQAGTENNVNEKTDDPQVSGR